MMKATEILIEELRAEVKAARAETNIVRIQYVELLKAERENVRQAWDEARRAREAYQELALKLAEKVVEKVEPPPVITADETPPMRPWSETAAEIERLEQQELEAEIVADRRRQLEEARRARAAEQERGAESQVA